MDADVAVLGAGFGGITAARDLHDAGRRVVVLEARDQIGGRTWYREMPGAGISVEYGGMFFSRATQPHLAAEIERHGIGVDRRPDWVSDPYSKGTWLATPRGWFSDGTFEALTSPEGRLAFAGSDIAPDGAGWIDGAVGSDATAASYALGLLEGG